DPARPRRRRPVRSPHLRPQDARRARGLDRKQGHGRRLLPHRRPRDAPHPPRRAARAPFPPAGRSPPRRRRRQRSPHDQTSGALLMTDTTARLTAAKAYIAERGLDGRNRAVKGSAVLASFKGPEAQRLAALPQRRAFEAAAFTR